jgi:hypothetical protein
MPEHPHIDISKLLHCGCYALLKKGEVIYVGKSKKPMVRLYTHFSNRGKVLGQNMWGGYSGPTLNDRGVNFDGVWFWPCMLGQLGTIEMYLIRKYMPKYNQVGKPGPVLPIPDDIRAILKQMITITGLPPLEDRPKVYIRRML